MSQLFDELEFLRESNNIESVWDDDALERAFLAWDFIKGFKEVNTAAILKTHKILALHSNLLPDQKGYFRQEPVYIAGREGKPWYAVRALIENWCQEMNTDKSIDKERQLHVTYESIHPFIDFNGRTGRIFLNWYRLRLGEPLLVIRESDKMDYYAWFDEGKINN